MSAAAVVAFVSSAIVVLADVGELRAEAISVERPVTIAVAPESFRLFGDFSEGEAESGGVEAYRAGVERYLANHPESYTLVAPEEVREAYRSQPRFEETREEAAEWAKYGIANYKELQNEEAIDQLENAVERYDRIEYEVVDPEGFAEVLMYLALSYLNEGNNAARPLDLMKRMVRLDPSRVLREGFYPDRITGFYRSARRDVVRRLLEDGPSRSRARTLLERTGAKLAVFGGVFREDAGGYRAELYVYSGAADAFLEAESVGVEEPTEANLRSAANRMMSRFTPCLYQPKQEGASRTVMESSGKGPFSMNLTFAYASFLEYPDPPIEKPFGNAGAGLGADLALTDEFGVGVGVHMLSSIRDYSGRIIGSFSTVRIFAGPDLGLDVGAFNFGISVAMEGTNIGSFEICRPEDKPPERCTGNDRKAYDDLDLLVGINARPRIRYRLLKSFELITAASFSTYLLPADRPLNNPVAGEIGLRYRF